jgi:hypothetical protein
MTKIKRSANWYSGPWTMDDGCVPVLISVDTINASRLIRMKYMMFEMPLHPSHLFVPERYPIQQLL